jgi:hypothetical protein
VGSPVRHAPLARQGVDGTFAPATTERLLLERGVMAPYEVREEFPVSSAAFPAATNVPCHAECQQHQANEGNRSRYRLAPKHACDHDHREQDRQEYNRSDSDPDQGFCNGIHDGGSGLPGMVDQNATGAGSLSHPVVEKIRLGRTTSKA